MPAPDAPDRDPRPTPSVPARRGSSGSELAGVGIQFGLAVALFALAGNWLDHRLGTSPWLLIVMVFVGAGAAFYSIYRKVFGPGSGTTPSRRP